MYGKARTEGARYICPQCFTAHYRNDVLFGTQRLTDSCDRRQAAFRYALGPSTAFARWCGGGKTSVLLNWRTLPQSRRQWENGAIMAVRDLDGRWVTQRICPCCHMPLSSPYPVVIGWKSSGMHSKTASSLLSFVAETAPDCWKTRQDRTLPLWYDYLENASKEVVFGVPVRPERVGGSYGASYRRRCCESASGAVVRRGLRMEESGSLDNTEAVRALDTMLEAFDYSGVKLKVSVVFLLELEGVEDQPDAVELFRRECPQLVRLIQYNFADSYFAANPCGRDPQAAAWAVKWLSSRVSRLNAGE